MEQTMQAAIPKIDAETYLKKVLVVAKYFSIFPAHIKDKRKVPRIKGWYKKATQDLEQIKKWWAKWPDANIAVRTGKVSGIVVVDIDVGRGGLEAWAEIEDTHGRVDTLTSITGGGGRHLIFRAPDADLKSTSDQIAPGIDTRAEGGYIIAPPSVHISGQCYEWEGTDL